jgi:TPR repeat protein
MPDPEFKYSRTASAEGAGGHTPPVAPFPRVACPKCSADVTLLPSAARFCNRCGFALTATTRTGRTGPIAATSRARSGRLFSRPRWLFNLWFACLDCDSDCAASAGRSAVLLAYGKSMFKLGWRYEHAVGARRNLTEAARCYWKAARLGDATAAGRLASARARSATDAETGLPVPV